MSTLPKDSSFISRFLNGDNGWSHAAQEFGLWAALIGFSGWLVSPLLAIVFVFLLLKFMDDHWRKREVEQSLNKGRRGDAFDMSNVPSAPTNFWTADAIADVMFPRKMRKVWLILSLLYIAWTFSKFGFVGFWLARLLA